MATNNDDELSVLEKQVEELQKQLEAAVVASNDVKKAVDGDLQKQMDALLTKQEELEAENALLKAWGDLTPDEKAHHKDLSSEDKASFMDMTPEERKKKMKKVLDDDEVIKVAGHEIRKSVVGVGPFEIMKAQAAQIAKNEEDIKKERDARETAELIKRADDEFSHVPGTSVERAQMLKAINGLGEDLKKSFETVLTQAEKLAKAGFDKLGHRGGKSPGENGEGDISKAASSFESKVVDIQSRDKCSRTTALSKARRCFPFDLAKNNFYRLVQGSP